MVHDPSSSEAARRKFECSVCPKAFLDRGGLQMHMRTHTGERPYQCTECQKGFTQEGALKVHVQRVHLKEKTFRCVFCAKSFAAAAPLVLHLRTHTGEKPYKCSYCPKEFADPSAIKVHLRFHTGERRFKCTFCDKAFHLGHHLRNHIRTHTGEKPCKCEHCPMAFADPAALARHRTIHQEVKGLKCTVCQKEFRLVADMNKHLKNHTGEKPHQCTVCKKRFKSGCNLKEHLFYHHADSGPYECSLCYQFFRFPSYLISHLSHHVRTPPFGCPLCHKPQGDRRALYHHLKEHVPLKAVQQLPYQVASHPFLCTECGGTFRKRERLLQHLWTHIQQRGRGRGGRLGPLRSAVTSPGTSGPRCTAHTHTPHLARPPLAESQSSFPPADRVRSSAQSKEDMEHLPDDVLVTLMEYLDVEGLLACRLVCKRVGDLALHRDVWRHRQLPGSRCVCPVLRLAPCVASLNIELQHHHRCGLAYIATRCAVTRLSLSLRKDCDAMPAAAVICRQEALGRLRSVQVDFGYILDVSYVLGTLATTADLEELQVTGLEYHAPATAAAVPGSPVSTPSLRFFRCELLPQTQHFVNFILAGHAATLQRVDLGHWRYGTDSTGHLLGGLPNLRQLKCSSMPGLEAFAACESLQDLDLLVSWLVRDGSGGYNRAAVAGAAQLLRRAKNLRELRLEYEPPLCFAEQDGVDHLLDLASSGRSCLEKLTVYNYYIGTKGFFPVQTLVSVLPSLSALVHLKVDANVRPDELLLAITPDVAPALQEVDVWLQRGTCPHGWIHGDAVKAVLSANPSLHVGVGNNCAPCIGLVSQVKSRGRDRCSAACVLDCHVVLREFGTRAPFEWFFCLFSHDPTARCSRGHWDDFWIHVPV